MSTALMVVVVIAVLLAGAAIGYVVWQQTKSKRLRDRFGPEYDRTVEAHGDRAAAERELKERTQRHQELELHDLEPAERDRYAQEWTRVQEQFVDAPEDAVAAADRLVTTVMGDRGYPTEGFDDRVAHLSVEHGRTLDHYRNAHEISSRAGGGEASTEELRQAMVHYRALFEELLAVPVGHDRATADAAASDEQNRGAE